MDRDATATMKAKMKHQTRHKAIQDKQVRTLLMKFRNGEPLTEVKPKKDRGLKTDINATIQQQLKELRLILKDIK
jgi:hypothetical protein